MKKFFVRIWGGILRFLFPKRYDKPTQKGEVRVMADKTVEIKSTDWGFKVKPGIVKIGPDETIDFKAPTDRDIHLFFPHASDMFVKTGQVVYVQKGDTETKTIASSPSKGLFPYAVFCFDSNKKAGTSDDIGLFADGNSTPVIHIDW